MATESWIRRHGNGFISVGVGWRGAFGYPINYSTPASVLPVIVDLNADGKSDV